MVSIIPPYSGQIFEIITTWQRLLIELVPLKGELIRGTVYHLPKRYIYLKFLEDWGGNGFQTGQVTGFHLSNTSVDSVG